MDDGYAVWIWERTGVKMPLAWREKERNTASISHPKTALGNNPPVAEPWDGRRAIASGHPTTSLFFRRPS
jgi:hypothetical protein